jgi:hypothetical protein
MVTSTRRVDPIKTVFSSVDIGWKANMIAFLFLELNKFPLSMAQWY